LQKVSKLETIEHHARLAMLGAAKKRKNTGLIMVGRESLPKNRWYRVTNNTR
jgi:hypothetical protein